MDVHRFVNKTRWCNKILPLFEHVLNLQAHHFIMCAIILPALICTIYQLIELYIYQVPTKQ